MSGPELVRDCRAPVNVQYQRRALRAVLTVVLHALVCVLPFIALGIAFAKRSLQLAGLAVLLLAGLILALPLGVLQAWAVVEEAIGSSSSFSLLSWGESKMLREGSANKSTAAVDAPVHVGAAAAPVPMNQMQQQFQQQQQQQQHGAAARHVNVLHMRRAGSWAAQHDRAMQMHEACLGL